MSEIENECKIVKLSPILRGVIETVVMFVTIVILMFFIWFMFLVFSPSGSWLNIVDGTSMHPTLRSGQILFTDYEEFGRGDIITIQMPTNDLNENVNKRDNVIVKRIVGLPGDDILINNEGVFVNGEKLNETYLIDEDVNSTYLSECKYNNVQLASTQFFVMGDNRDNSYDSRYFGPVESSDVLYKQSATPTKTFYLKSLALFFIFLLNVYMYDLIETVLINCVYNAIYKCKKKKNNSNNKKIDDTKGEW